MLTLIAAAGNGLGGPTTSAPLWPYVLGGVASIIAALIGGAALMRSTRRDALARARQEADVANELRLAAKGREDNRRMIEELRDDLNTHTNWATQVTTRLQDDVSELRRTAGINGRHDERRSGT